MSGQLQLLPRQSTCVLCVPPPASAMKCSLNFERPGLGSRLSVSSLCVKYAIASHWALFLKLREKGQPSTRREHLLLYFSARMWARPLTTAPEFSIGPSMSLSLQKRRHIISDGQNSRCPLQPLPYFHSFTHLSSIRPFSETLSFAVLTVRS